MFISDDWHLFGMLLTVFGALLTIILTFVLIASVATPFVFGIILALFLAAVTGVGGYLVYLNS